MSPAQPSSCEPADVADRGGQRQDTGSGRRCPASRTRARNRGRSGRSSFAPCDTTSGWIRSRRSARTWSMPDALRRAQPLVRRCRSSTPRRARRGRRRPCPGRGRRRRACPRRAGRARGRSRSTGRTSAVGEVTWLTRANRVRGGDRLRGTPRRASDGSRIGNGIRTMTTRRAVAGSAAARSALSVALYSWSLGQQLVAGLEPQRGEDGRDAGRRVGHERDALGIRLEEHARPAGGPRRGAARARGRGTGPAAPPCARATRAGPRGPGPGTRRTSRG